MFVRPGHRSLARKYTIFTGLLLSYVVFIFVIYDIWAGTFHPVKASALALAALLIAGAISKFTNRLLARPLRYLQEAMVAVREGKLEPIQVSRTGDEIEFVGESFNAMIENLVSSREKLEQHQESLEDQVRERTRALEKVSQKALAANQAKSEFLANMSHELRTPMSGVLGMLDIALDGNLEPGQREHLLTAKGCASTLLALLNDILDLSKIEAGKMALEDVSFDLRTVVTESLRAMAPEARRKGISLRSSVQPEVPESIMGDPLRTRQILVNLLSNAVKFTDTGHVDVSVGLRGSPQELGTNLEIRVVDTGTGIPSEKLPLIFEQFTQADGSISRRFGGTGLGLTITRRLVELLDGGIAVESELGVGSTFLVSIPCRAVCELPLDGSSAAPSNSAPEGAEAEGPPHILIVEDNLVNQKVVSAMLRRHGYRVSIVDHGGMVIEALERDPVALVLMDVQMPTVDGLEATRMIRNRTEWRDLPIVAMTAHAMDGDRDRCLRQGMDEYIAKPINRQHLVAVVEKQLLNRARTVIRASEEVYSTRCAAAGTTSAPVVA